MRNGACRSDGVTPTDIAAAMLYLAGPSGRYMTGQSVMLDGGFLIS
jgi:NAD(P)-dependent dehydrogenase (short-subunit alcohol dehydrogenase family)